MSSQEEDAEIEQDVLKLQIHSIPLNLNWDQNEVEEEEDSDDEDVGEYEDLSQDLPTFQETYEDQPSTSHAGAVASHPLVEEEEDDSLLDMELIDLSSDFEPTPLNLLKLNFAYQEVIEQQIATVDRLLQENHYKKSMITENIQRASKQTGSSPKLEASLFNKLFFKDNHGCGPSNIDIERRRSEVGPEFTLSLIPAPKWKKAANQALIAGIEKNAQRIQMEPLLTKLEYMQEKFKKDESPQIETKIIEVQQKIEEIKHQKKFKLMDDRSQTWDWHSIANIEFDNHHNAVNCELHWKNSLHPSINHSSWTSAEDKKLADLVAKHKNHDWNVINSELGTRRAVIDVVRRYQLKINTSFRSRPWTPEEDARLVKLIEKYRVGNVIPYTKIAFRMKTRYATQIVHRWSKSLDPSYKRTRFTPQEDASLLRAVLIHGQKWALIRDLGLVPGRNDAQLRERYVNSLEAHRRSVWSKEEDIVLSQLVRRHGEGNWSLIASEITGRTDCQCLRRWTSLKTHYKNGKKLVYRNGDDRCENLLRLRRKLRTAIKAEHVAIKKESLDGFQGASTSKVIQESNENIMTSEDIIKAYCDITRRKNPYVKKRPPKSEEEQVFDKAIHRLMELRFRPMAVEAQRPNNNFNKTLLKCTENSKKINSKEVFVHFIKALNINAERALESIKDKKRKSTRKKVPTIKVRELLGRELAQESAANRVKSAMTSKANSSTRKRIAPTPRLIGANGSGDSDVTSPARGTRAFARNLYLPLCAPNRSTVRAYRDMTKDRERRVTNAKSILQLPEDTNPLNGAGKSDKKFKTEDMLSNLRSTYQYKIFRSRFNALFTWPTLLSSLVPYTRKSGDGSLQAAVKTKRTAIPRDESSSKRRKIS